MGQRLVVIESPFAGDVESNVRYARACMADAFKRGECPFASHLLYPGTLDDDVPEQRKLGIEAGFAWAVLSDVRAVYYDRGISTGMCHGIIHSIDVANEMSGAHKLTFRSLQGKPEYDAAIDFKAGGESVVLRVAGTSFDLPAKGDRESWVKALELGLGMIFSGPGRYA